MNNSDIVIKQSRFKLLLFLLLSILMTWLCIHITFFFDPYDPVTGETYGRYNIEDVRPITIIGIFLFGCGSLVKLYQLIKPRNLLRIGKDGFTDYDSYTGFVSWRDVKYISITPEDEDYPKFLPNVKYIRVELRGDISSKKDIDISLLEVSAKQYEEILKSMQGFWLAYSPKNESSQYIKYANEKKASGNEPKKQIESIGNIAKDIPAQSILLNKKKKFTLPLLIAIVILSAIQLTLMRYNVPMSLVPVILAVLYVGLFHKG